MKHRLAITIGQSKIVERAFSAAGVTCHIENDEPGYVLITQMYGRKGVMYPRYRFTIVNDHYIEEAGTTTCIDDSAGIGAVLAVLTQFLIEFYGGNIARILVAATRQALCCHELISDADRKEDSIDSGDAIDRCYDAVRVVLPEYTTSSDIEPTTSSSSSKE